MRIRFSDHFTCKKLLRLTFPSMIMLVFTSIYGVVDGFFVSKFIRKNAFTAVNDGQINLTPNQTAINAAQDAMNGWDPSYGSLYYYNPVTATSSWIFSRETVTTIGRHVFAI